MNKQKLINAAIQIQVTALFFIARTVMATYTLMTGILTFLCSVMLVTDAERQIFTLVITCLEHYSKQFICDGLC